MGAERAMGSGGEQGASEGCARGGPLLRHGASTLAGLAAWLLCRRPLLLPMLQLHLQAIETAGAAHLAFACRNTRSRGAAP